MSVEKQIPSLCKLYSFYEEIPEQFLDKTDVDSCFYHNMFYIFQSQHRIVLVSRGSKIKSFAIKLFQFCDLETQQRYIVQEEVKFSKRKIPQEPSVLLFYLKNRLYLNKFLKKCLDSLSVKAIHAEQVPVIW